MSNVLKLDINTELIKTVVPLHVRITPTGTDVVLEGVRYYDVDRYIKLTSGMNKVYDYLSLVISEWRAYLINNYVYSLDKDDPVIDVVENDVNDFMVAFFEAMREIQESNKEVTINLPNYPINYFKISLTNNGTLTYSYIQPSNAQGYYIKRLEEMNKHKLSIMKKTILRTLT